MFVMTESEGIINLNYYDRIRIENNNLIATTREARKYIVTFDDPDHAEKALSDLFDKMEKGKPGWNGKLYKDQLLNPDKYPVI